MTSLDLLYHFILTSSEPTSTSLPHVRVDRAQELCESRGGRLGLPVPNKPYGFCGRTAALNPHVRVTSPACLAGRSSSKRPAHAVLTAAPDDVTIGGEDDLSALTAQGDGLHDGQRVPAARAVVLEGSEKHRGEGHAGVGAGLAAEPFASGQQHVLKQTGQMTKVIIFKNHTRRIWPATRSETDRPNDKGYYL